MSRYISFRDFDWLLFIFVLMICGLGVMEIRSATSHTKFAGAHIRQVYWIAGGVAGMFLISLINYQKLLDRIHWLYIAAIVSLMSVMLFGQKYLGARRWIKMPGGAHFQPSEWVKLILILAVAKYFADLHSEGAFLAGLHEGGCHCAGADAHGAAPARSGYQPYVSADRYRRTVSGRGALQAGRDCDHRGGLALASCLARLEALPEGPSDQLHASGGRQSGFRVPGQPVFDCRRIRRYLGEFGGFPDPFGVSYPSRKRTLSLQHSPRNMVL